MKKRRQGQQSQITLRTPGGLEEEEMELRSIKLQIHSAELKLDPSQYLKVEYMVSGQEIKRREERLRTYVKAYLGQRTYNFNDNALKPLQQRVDTFQDVKYLEEKHLQKKELESKKTKIRVENALRNHFRQTQISEGHLNPVWKQTFEFQRITENFINFNICQKTENEEELVIGEVILRLDKYILNVQREPLKKVLKIKSGMDEVGTLTVNLELSYQQRKKPDENLLLYRFLMDEFSVTEIDLNLELIKSNEACLSLHLKSPKVQHRQYSSLSELKANSRYDFTDSLTEFRLTEEQMKSSPQLFIDLIIFHDKIESSQKKKRQDLAKDYQYQRQTVLGICQIDLANNFQEQQEKMTPLPRPQVLNRYGKYVAKLNFQYQFMKPRSADSGTHHNSMVINNSMISQQPSVDFKYLSPEYHKLREKLEQQQKIKERFRSNTSQQQPDPFLPHLIPPISTFKLNKQPQNLGGLTERFKEQSSSSSQVGQSKFYSKNTLPENITKLDQQLELRRKKLLSDALMSKLKLNHKN